MYASLWKLGWETTLLAMETQQVVALRMAKLMTGDAAAGVEAQLMVSEKVFAMGEAAMTVATGGHPRKVVRNYRHKVRANKRRLSKSKSSPGTY